MQWQWFSGLLYINTGLAIKISTLRLRQNSCHFPRWHFQMNFLEWKCMNFDYDFTEVCSQGTNQQYSNIVSDNGLALNRWQAIFWNCVGMLYWCIYASLGLNDNKEIQCGAIIMQSIFSSILTKYIPWMYFFGSHSDLYSASVTACMQYHIDGLVQERRNSSANALELRLSCTNPSISYWTTL